MSNGSERLRRIPTLWLDSNDDKNDVSDEDEYPGLPRYSSKGDWETIMDKTTTEAKTTPEHRDKRISVLQLQQECDRNENAQPQSKQYFGSRTFSSANREDWFNSLGLCCLPSASVSEIGSGRFIGNCGLLTSRLVLLSVLGISAGVVFAIRESAPATSMLTELFMWLHMSYLILIPFLALASFMSTNSTVEGVEEEQEDLCGSLWVLASVASHVANTFAQAELVRIFVLHAVPLLQPFMKKFGTNQVYCLTSVFAFQRYIMAVFSITELLFSKTPNDFLHTVVVLFVSTCWELCMFRIRVLEKTVLERIALSLGSIALAVNLSMLNVIAYKALAACGSKALQIDDGRGRVPEIF